VEHLVWFMVNLPAGVLLHRSRKYTLNRLVALCVEVIVILHPAPYPTRSGREVDTNLGYRLHNPVLPEGDKVDYYLDNTSRFGRVLGATDFLYNNCNQDIFLLFCIYTGSWFQTPQKIIAWTPRLYNNHVAF